MTGFGHAERANAGWLARVRVASVNRRQQDLQIQLPRDLAEWEPKVRELLVGRFSRGRWQVAVEVEATRQGEATIGLDPVAAEAAVKILRQWSEAWALEGGVTLEALLRVPGVLRSETGASTDRETLWPVLEEAVVAAAEEIRTMQAREGAALAEDCRTRTALLATELAAIERQAPEVPKRHRENLRQRIEKALGEVPVDEERLAREIALFADRCDISEEITRARLHITRFEEKLDETESAGRVLDFLAQELAREFNTISAKANDAQIAEHVVVCKAEVEKIREQVQNIE